MTPKTPLHVLIAGGGIAALETATALHALAGDRVRITLLAPRAPLRLRALAVAEPFAIARAPQVPLAAIAADVGAEVVVGELAAVEPERRRALPVDGPPIDYDALVIACGTRARPALRGAVTIDDKTLGETMRGLVRDVEDGYASEIAFVAPAQAPWPLPLYELALQLANRAYEMNADVDVRVVSPERAPLAVYGAGISDALGDLLARAGITFHGSSFAELAHGELTLWPDATRLRPDRVVALPLLEGPPITGIPSDPHGFVAVDELGEVRGLDGVYAAGDVTAGAFKHGSVAAQQADTVAAAIAERAGAPVRARPHEPVIRGQLLTGREPIYFEARCAADGTCESSVSASCPWDPPTKVATQHLARHLAAARGERVG